MQNNKFIVLLNSFSSIKLNKFEKYLDSPYFNSDKKLTIFFNKFKNKALHKIGNIEKEELWKIIFNNTSFNDQKLNRVFSDLCGHLENFMTIEKIISDKLLFGSTKVNVLSKPGLKKSYKSAIKKFNANIENTDSSVDKNYFLYKTQRIEHEYLYQSGGNYTDFHHLNKADLHIDRMYIILKLQHYIEQLDYTRKYNKGPDISISKGFLNLIGQKKYQDEPTIKSFYLIQELLTKPDENNKRFFELLNILKNSSKKSILFKDIKNMYLAVINYCINLHINKGNNQFYPLLFDVYKTALKQKIFHTNGILHYQSYKNIITVGLHVKDFTWVEKFIKEYTENLQQNLKKNALNYNLATLAYKKKDYNTVISQMNLVTYDNIYYALGTRMFLLRTYYETDAEIPFESLVFSFGAYIKRNKKLSQNMKKQYLNFIKILKKIYYLNIFDTSKIAKLEAEISNTATLIHKPYLLQQWKEKIKK